MPMTLKQLALQSYYDVSLPPELLESDTVTDAARPVGGDGDPTTREDDTAAPTRAAVSSRKRTRVTAQESESTDDESE